MKTPKEIDVEYPSLAKLPRTDDGYILEDYIKKSCDSPNLGEGGDTIMMTDDILSKLSWKNIGKGRFGLSLENVHNKTYMDPDDYASNDKTWKIVVYDSEEHIGLQPGFPTVTIEGKGSRVKCYPTYYLPGFLIPADVLNKLVEILNILKDAPNDGSCPLDGKIAYDLA